MKQGKVLWQTEARCAFTPCPHLHHEGTGRWGRCTAPAIQVGSDGRCIMAAEYEAAATIEGSQINPDQKGPTLREIGGQLHFAGTIREFHRWLGQMRLLYPRPTH